MHTSVRGEPEAQAHRMPQGTEWDRRALEAGCSSDRDCQSYFDSLSEKANQLAVCP